MKRLIRRVVLIFLSFIGILACFWWFENWRGNNAWQEAQERAQAASFSLNLADYQSPLPPDQQNLLLNPLFLKEWEGELDPPLQGWDAIASLNLKKQSFRLSDPRKGLLLNYQSCFEDKLTEQEAIEALHSLTESLQNRQQQFVEILLSYPPHRCLKLTAPTTQNPIPMDPIANLQRLARCLRDHSTLALHREDPSTALNNIRALARLEECFCRGSMIRALVGTSLHRVIDQIIWVGIKKHAWNHHDLQELKKLLGERDYFKDLESLVGFEVIFGIRSVDLLDQQIKLARQAAKETLIFDTTLSLQEKVALSLQTGGPAGWTDQRKAILVDNALDFLSELQSKSMIELSQREEQNEAMSFHPFECARANAQALRAFLRGMLKAQTWNRIAQLSLAAEQFFLEHQTYPSSLEEFSLDFQPIDAMDREHRSFTYELDELQQPKFMAPSDPTVRWLFSPEEK